MTGAWWFWSRGISVAPVPAPSATSDGKRPAIPWKEYQSRLATIEEMGAWFDGRPTNYAVITGAVSGICVVDVDDRSAVPMVRWNLTPTPWIVGTRRGYHLYYRYPVLPVRNRVRIAGSKVDVRGDGGYVIGPGSAHSSGFKYRWLGDWSVPRDQIPVFDPSVLSEPAPAPPTRPRARPAGDAADRARRYLARIPRPVEGFGSDAATFTAACYLVRGFGLSADDATALLQEWAPDFDAWWIRGKVENASKHGSEPTGGKL